MPCLMLRPIDRILYVCGACCLANIYGALCPWCLGTCAEDSQSHELSTYSQKLRRRVSSPSLLNNLQKAQLERLEKRVAAVNKSPVTRPKPLGPISSESMNQTIEKTLELPTDTSSPVQIEDDLRKRRRIAVCYSMSDIVATATEVCVRIGGLALIADMVLSFRIRTCSPSSSK